ncbi:hypothetical protein JNW91_11760 [Micromonospora sp. STR1_7]|uniref:Uncharacterized protein n=1 Tax=Micromonospora parastrephiae TaxID=2806101 RepID=A0ABS1XTA7_9ACTN|nr:hypothetical protein [Micromonospora parastrephiae]MBM0232481.1 hypothetical protein [Micromonospora parastrephiae]
MAGNSGSRRLAQQREYLRIDASKLNRIVDRAEFNRVTKALERRLQDFEMDGFSEPAAVALAECQTLYFRQLGEESISLAKGDRLDSVSADHVRRATSRLRHAASPPWKAVLNIIGGALLGTAIQEIVGIVNSDGPLEKGRALVTMALVAAGVAAVIIAVVAPRRS